MRRAKCEETQKECIAFALDEVDQLPSAAARGGLWTGLVDPAGRVWLLECIVQGDTFDVRAAIDAYQADGRAAEHASLLDGRPGWATCYGLTIDTTEREPVRRRARPATGEPATPALPQAEPAA